MSEQNEGFFSRWQLRRKKVEEEAQASQSTDVVEPIVEPEVPTVTAEVNEVADNSADMPAQTVNEVIEDPNKVLTAADLPDPDSIEVGGSFAQFMAKNVDPAAKTAALRALWKQPHFNELDGMVEYGLDYHKQPLMTAEESAEVAKKLFNNVKETVEKVLDATDSEPAQLANNDAAQSLEASETASDKLGDQQAESVQTGSIIDDKTNKPVA